MKFIKHLPVNEIPLPKLKLGDISLWPKGDDARKSGKFVTVNESNITHLESSGALVYKCYLVTGEFNEGDTVKDKTGKDMIVTKSVLGLKNSDLLYKVIAEVSEEALSFAKEGKEYLDEQIELWTYKTENRVDYNSFEESNFYMPVKSFGEPIIPTLLETMNLKILAKLVGPCGHLH